MRRKNIIYLAAAVMLAVALAGCAGSTDYIPLVQNGYLGEYTDMTVQELLSGYYSQMYDEETWDGGTTDDGKEIVQVTYAEGDFEDVAIQFTMLDEQCFEVTAFVDPLALIEEPADLLVELNYLYFIQYVAVHPDMAGDPDAEQEFCQKLDGISGSAVLYGAAQDYEGDRSRLCDLAGDTPLELCVLELLNASDLVNLGDYFKDSAVELVQNGYLGEYTDMTVQELLSGHYSTLLYDEENWESSTADSGGKVVTATFTDSSGDMKDATIQFTMLDDETFKVTSFQDPTYPVENATDLLGALNYFYFEQYGASHPEIAGTDKEQAFLKQLERIDGYVVQYGASAEYAGDRRKLCQIAGNLPTKGTVIEVLGASGLVDMNAYFPSPTPAPTPETVPEPESTGSFYEKFYGYYEYAAAYIYIGPGPDNDSVYVHVHFEPTAPWSAMHANIVCDGEPYMTFYADNAPTGSESVVPDQYSIAGAVSLQEIGGSGLYMELYKDQFDETPYCIMLE